MALVLSFKPKRKINLNKLAKEVSKREGLKKEVNIAQIKEVMKHTLNCLGQIFEHNPRGVADLLRDPARCAYPSDQVQLLTGESAQRDDILAALARLAEQTQADPEASAVVHFSGHGLETPGYYLMLKGWMALFGPGEFAVRLLSAVLGMVSVYLVFLVGARLFGPWVGLAAAGLAAINPLLVWLSQEVRMYMPAATLALGSTYCLLRALDRNGWGWWFGYGLQRLMQIRPC